MRSVNGTAIDLIENKLSSAIFGNFVLKSKINVNIYFTYKVVTNKWE